MTESLCFSCNIVTKNSDDDGSTERSSYPVGKTAAGISGGSPDVNTGKRGGKGKTAAGINGGSPDVNTGKRGGRSRAWKADR